MIWCLDFRVASYEDVFYFFLGSMPVLNMGMHMTSANCW